ncbi:hypothetical protein BJX66DRAFT_72420 [Aspergillus keveii]|uniref:Uncharacterized protein n=1 Tax=Aspergillus keveii TaxID=714993 RepID=A0ABR4GH55_9EURO
MAKLAVDIYAARNKACQAKIGARALILLTAGGDWLLSKAEHYQIASGPLVLRHTNHIMPIVEAKRSAACVPTIRGSLRCRKRRMSLAGWAARHACSRPLRPGRVLSGPRRFGSANKLLQGRDRLFSRDMMSVSCWYLFPTREHSVVNGSTELCV